MLDNKGKAVTSYIVYRVLLLILAKREVAKLFATYEFLFFFKHFPLKINEWVTRLLHH